ncbi:hypothetical protein CGCS363_v014212 [Colletotrichum siamense]|uniref:uncharacterized protein n=1 Tax=Colletotrichum siamense TaxID=690259 RepID=UPI0018724DB5|nr:uncharacterized protein CGCS363_v014212 [Colletotrichum siamense]KAF5485092.1 hypothetical protein CGCS363_v014212 [Colletotrichum siamense]
MNAILRLGLHFAVPVGEKMSSTLKSQPRRAGCWVRHDSDPRDLRSTRTRDEDSSTSQVVWIF